MAANNSILPETVFNAFKHGTTFAGAFEAELKRLMAPTDAALLSLLLREPERLAAVGDPFTRALLTAFVEATATWTDADPNDHLLSDEAWEEKALAAMGST